MSDDKKAVFLNRREWSSYLSALQSSTGYPSLKDAVKSGRDWVSENAAHATSWLAMSHPLKGKLSG